jgi:cellulose synthase/poly-beta-1,6-N-acetylglucosamine synthase-like glycosyltransferase
MLLTLFWFSIAVVVYTYVGYALVVGIWARLVRRGKPQVTSFEPEVTVVVPAYNEGDILAEKVNNCLSLNYPVDKLRVIFITDGSTDDSETVLATFPQVQHLHTPERGGKSMAENRAVRYVTTPYVIFTDCNTVLNSEAVRNLVRHYADPNVGAVSGEKRVLSNGSAIGAGEGMYWKYESFLKQCDSDIYSLMGAAGELVSFRTNLFYPLEADTILDDFVQSMRIVDAGHRVVYEPKAYAMESPSFSLREEMKRKVRICAGGWQSMARLPSLLNPLRQPVVTFLYVSHRVLRWSLTPLLMAILLPLNVVLAMAYEGIYSILLCLHAGFYGAALVGWWRAARGKATGPLLVPLYFTMMNVAVFQGFWRFVNKTQPAAWDKAQRVIT